MGCVSCCCCCLGCYNCYRKTEDQDEIRECESNSFGIFTYALVLSIIFLIPYLSYLQSDEHWKKLKYTCEDRCGSLFDS
jgi:hypothetical protein